MIFVFAKETGEHTDVDGFMYAFNVTQKVWDPCQSITSCVRKRFWTRRAVYDPVAFLAGTEGSASPEKKRAPYEPVQRIISCFENERWVVMAGFSRRHLLPTDPAPFTDLEGRPLEREAPLQKGWDWVGDWRVKISGDFPADDQGWSYRYTKKSLVLRGLKVSFQVGILESQTGAPKLVRVISFVVDCGQVSV